MGLVDKIENGDSLEAWLKTQPKQVSVDIAHRAAMRVLPWDWELRSRRDDFTALPILRANLITSVAAEVPTSVIKAAAAATTIATVASATAATTTAANAAHFAGTTIAAVAANAAHFAATTTDTVWETIRRDARLIEAGEGILGRPLWHDAENTFSDDWEKVKASLPQGDPAWDFWQRWYQGALDGEPLPEALIVEIGKRDPQEWEGTDAEVNGRIAEIVSDFAKARSSNAERVFVNADGRYQTEPILDIPEQILATALDRIRDALTEFQAIPEGDNLRGACDREIARIEDYLARYEAVPIRIYEVLVRTIRRIDKRCDEGDLTLHDERLEDFRTELDSSALDILQNTPSVKEAISLRALGRFDRLSDVEKEHYLALMEYLAAGSVPALAKEMREDGATATDEAADEDDRAEATVRSGGRALRMRDLRDKARNTADDVVKAEKGVEGAMGLWEIIQNIFL